MSRKPDFIIVPGAWHSPDAFDPTSTFLRKAGYEVHGVDLPSYGADPPLKSFDLDVLAVQNVINKVLSSGKDVIMIYHSSGGMAGSEALKEYVNEVGTDKSGKQGWGRVRRLVYVTAFALPEGASLMSGLGFKPLPWFEIDGDAVFPANPKEIFYNDLSDSQAAPLIAAIKQHSYLTYASTLTVAPWKTIPSTFIKCEKDNAIPLPVQEGMIAGAKEMAPGAFDVIEKCQSGHSPFVSQPAWLAEKLVESAK
ncbi:related to signal peptide protein [Rhynchosporium agropyri]|uniref:Related to signal peptide protein n=1 Tax=Rhynchosporium agropyri TaxID=914238 RepID=A0A1E1KIS0_9HELO|nr:related to signal peptide protein [Rhynchosporium agropyri]